MKITLITVGKIKEKYLKDAIAEYSKRLSRYCKLEIIEVADEKTPDNASETVEDGIRDKEGERILKYVKDDAYVVTLEIKGKLLTSEELAEKIEQLQSAIATESQNAADAEKWIALMKECVNPTELTAELLNTLIEKIVVHEAVKGEDGSREQEVEIFYRFIGKID